MTQTTTDFVFQVVKGSLRVTPERLFYFRAAEIFALNAQVTSCAAIECARTSRQLYDPQFLDTR